LHPRNILLFHPTLLSWSSSEDVNKYLGLPRISEFDSDSQHAPKYIIRSALPVTFQQECFPPVDARSNIEVKICDFGESFEWIPETPSFRIMNTCLKYAAPEVIFKDTVGPALDVWSFACVMYDILSGDKCLFSSWNGTKEEILRGMVLLLGKPPDAWWNKWTTRGNYFDDDGNWIGDDSALSRILRPLGALYGRSYPHEEKLVQEFLNKLVRYDPRERPTAQEVLSMLPEEWMSGDLYPTVYGDELSSCRKLVSDI
ncbi:hypothetical protein M422DRAFT_265194, partial [Sphaerobolus stellatus SS14]